MQREDQMCNYFYADGASPRYTGCPLGARCSTITEYLAFSAIGKRKKTECRHSKSTLGI